MTITVLDQPNRQPEIPLQICGKTRIHRAQFGWIYDPITGKPDYSQGRQFHVLSKGHPDGCYPVLTPLRIAENVTAVIYQIDKTANPNGALVGTPVYEGFDNAGQGALFALTRISSGKEAEAYEQVGKHVGSNSVLIGWDQYGDISADLKKTLPETQSRIVNSMSDIHARIAAPAHSFGEVSAPVQSALGFVIFAAILSGETLRLNDKHANSEAEFLEALGFALSLLPSKMRAHISFSAGWIWPDDDIQIAWSPLMGGRIPSTTEFSFANEAGRFAAYNRMSEPDDFELEIKNEPYVYLGRLMPCWHNAGMHNMIRKSVADHLRGWKPDGKVVKSGHDYGQWVEKQQAAFELNANSIFPIAFSPCDHPDQGWDKAFLDWLSGFRCLGEEHLSLIADCEPARRIVAKALGEGLVAYHNLFERSMCLFAMKAGHSNQSFRRLAGAFLPDGRKLYMGWSDFRSEQGPFGGVLESLTNDPRSIPTSIIKEMTEYHCRNGERQIATQTLLSMSLSIADFKSTDCSHWLKATAAIISGLEASSQNQAETLSNVVRLRG